MQIIKLWKTTRPDGGITVSPVSGDYSDGVRLAADEGMLLTNGEITTACIDVASADGWTEVADPDAPQEDEATTEDYQAALRGLGVDV